MSQTRRPPGAIRDAILNYLHSAYPDPRHVRAIHAAVSETLGENVPKSSVRSYLNLNTPSVFERTTRGYYKMRSR